MKAQAHYQQPILDGVVSALGWLAFYFFRKTFVEGAAPLWQPQTFLLATVVGLGWVWLLYVHGVYGPLAQRIVMGWQLARVVLLGVLVVFVTSWLNDPVPSYQSFHYMLVVYWLLQWSILVLLRLLLHALRPQNPERALVLCSHTQAAVQIMQQYTLAWQGVVYMQAPDSGVAAVTHLGQWPQLRGLLRMRQRLGVPIEAVVVATEGLAPNQYLQLHYLAAQFGARVWLPSHIQLAYGQPVHTSALLGRGLLMARSPVQDNPYLPLKRSMDVVCSALLLLLLWPLLLLVAAGIRLDSTGPALFRQLRIGRYGRPFVILKLRTMVLGAEQRGPLLAMPNDARVTRVGRWLRRYHMDELPQLWNVLMGQMSLVGPRPERRFFFDQIVLHEPVYEYVLQLRPGITGWAQVMHGYTRTLPKMLARVPFDSMYVNNLSLGLDVRILLYTLRKLFRGQGE